MKKNSTGDKHARFQWIRDARAEMSREMAELTPEETVDYVHAKFLEARKGCPNTPLLNQRS